MHTAHGSRPNVDVMNLGSHGHLSVRIPRVEHHTFCMCTAQNYAISENDMLETTIRTSANTTGPGRLRSTRDDLQHLPCNPSTSSASLSTSPAVQPTSPASHRFLHQQHHQFLSSKVGRYLCMHVKKQRGVPLMMVKVGIQIRLQFNRIKHLKVAGGLGGEGR